MAEPAPSYEDALSALTGMLGRPVTITSRGEGHDEPATLCMAHGTLAAEPDDDLGEFALFSLEDQSFSAFLERSAFRGARITEDSVHVLIGHVWLEFDPPGVLV